MTSPKVTNRELCAELKGMADKRLSDTLAESGTNLNKRHMVEVIAAERIKRQEVTIDDSAKRENYLLNKERELSDKIKELDLEAKATFCGVAICCSISFGVGMLAHWGLSCFR